MAKVEELIIEEKLLEVEADTYYCFQQFIITMKQNYKRDFEGVLKNIEKVDVLLRKMDKKLYDHLQDNGVDIMSFAFRWFLCLLLRELPMHLAIKLMDYYLVEELYPNELCI